MIVGVKAGIPTGQSAQWVRSTEAFHRELKELEALTGQQCRCFSLILFDIRGEKRSAARRLLAKALAGRLRSTDRLGWFDANRLGVILPHCAANTAMGLAADVCHAVRERLSPIYTIHNYPCRIEPRPACDACKLSAQKTTRLADVEERGQQPLPLWKRALDVAGSLVGLALLSPVFVATSIFIKSLSKGPVFFRQERVGHMGRTFRVWKFRTYERNADTTHHEQYVKSLIDTARASKNAGEPSMRKLDNAPGIIPCGNLLRKTCIDEFPQLINVLYGQMSLVGPRPPIRYEVQQYDDWHKGRLCAVPGMTGLWQVSGKNRLTFNQMVRLDIQYLQHMSLWRDLAILLKTPMAILSQIRDSLRAERSGSSQGKGSIRPEYSAK